MANWTANDIPGQHGRVVLITGANSGIGYETTLALAKKGATVIMACRNIEKGKEAQAQILKQAPNADLTVMMLDLADLTSVDDFVQNVKKTRHHLNVLINNAGVMATPFLKTKQGFELQIGTNYFGHYALTGLLLPLLEKAPGSRIITVSSVGSKYGRINFDDIMSERKYSKWNAYSQAKLANLVFGVELARRLKAANAKTISVPVHPGGAPTNLQRSSGFLMKNIITPLMSQPAEMAALPSLRAATDPRVSNGTYWGPSGFMELKGYPEQSKIPAHAEDPITGKRLWELGEQLTHVHFQF
jgi:NAD(P)-dependent dehydrogenase (short-subunit alcohol dehydrogenase family)